MHINAAMLFPQQWCRKCSECDWNIWFEHVGIQGKGADESSNRSSQNPISEASADNSIFVWGLSVLLQFLATSKDHTADILLGYCLADAMIDNLHWLWDPSWND